MNTNEITKRLLKIQQEIEHDNHTWENIKDLIDDINKTPHACGALLKHAHGYICPICYKITK